MTQSKQNKMSTEHLMAYFISSSSWSHDHLALKHQSGFLKATMAMHIAEHLYLVKCNVSESDFIYVLTKYLVFKT